MQNRKLITKATAILGGLSLICLIGYFLALHDIFHDYASPRVLQEQAGLAEGSLPGWTTCPLEWRIVGVGFWPMLVFHALFFLSLLWRATKDPQEIPNYNLRATPNHADAVREG